MSRLQGKYALITGASQGLGLQMAIADRFLWHEFGDLNLIV